MPDRDAALTALWHHPVLEDLFGDEASQSPRTLDGALTQLLVFGQPVLAAHDVRDQAGELDGAPEWVCSLNWRTREDELISASGPTPVAASLYCLMEAVYYVQRKTRAEIGSFDGLTGL